MGKTGSVSGLLDDFAQSLNDYAKMVNRINGYKKIKGISDAAKDSIDVQLAKVFDYAYKIETTKKNAAEAYENEGH